MLAALVVGACSTPPPPPPSKPLYDAKGIRQEPLTPDEAEKLVQGRAEQIAACYRRERINLDTKTGNYVFRVWIPNDGSEPDVEAVKQTVPGLVTLRGCLELVLEKTKFPAHVGEPITLMVPIEEL